MKPKRKSVSAIYIWLSSKTTVSKSSLWIGSDIITSPSTSNFWNKNVSPTHDSQWSASDPTLSHFLETLSVDTVIILIIQNLSPIHTKFMGSVRINNLYNKSHNAQSAYSSLSLSLLPLRTKHYLPLLMLYLCRRTLYNVCDLPGQSDPNSCRGPLTMRSRLYE